MKKILLSFASLLPLLHGVAFAADDFDPSLDALPPGEERFLAYPLYPSQRLWNYLLRGNLEAHTSRRSVGPDSSLAFFLPAGGTPCDLLAYDIGVQGERLKKFKGLSFWFRGDGGPGELSLGCSWDQTLPAYPKIGSYPLKSTSWTKQFVPFSAFTPPVDKSGFYFLNFHLTPAAGEAARAWLARVHLYSEEKTEAITPVDLDDPPGNLPAAKFVVPSPDTAAKLLPKTFAKLRTAQPVTLVAYGDSITAGAQLWYANKENRGRPLAYTSRLAERLGKFYRYPKTRVMHRFWAEPDKKAGRAEAGFEWVEGSANPDGSAPFDGLQVIGVGAGGKDSAFGVEHLDEVLRLKPDLVIWAFGANDATRGNPAPYRKFATQAIETLKAKGIEILLVAISPNTNNEKGWDQRYYTTAHTLNEVGLEIASANALPSVNFFDAFEARGRRYLGDLLSDTVHPNADGHRVMAAILAAALGEPDGVIWDQPGLQPETRKP